MGVITSKVIPVANLTYYPLRNISVTNDHVYAYSVACHNHNQVLSSSMTYHRVCNKNNTMGTSPLLDQELFTLPVPATPIHPLF